MSGKRAKALRKAFIKQHGRAPEKTQWDGLNSRGSVVVVRSEYRAVKRAGGKR